MHENGKRLGATVWRGQIQPTALQTPCRHIHKLAEWSGRRDMLCVKPYQLVAPSS